MISISIRPIAAAATDNNIINRITYYYLLITNQFQRRLYNK